MIKVLQLPGSLSRANGRMSVIMNIYRQLDRTKIQFDFLGTGVSGDTYIDEIQKLGGKVCLVPKNELNYHSVRSAIRKMLKLESYDCIHYHAISLWGAALGIAKHQGVRVIVHSHSTRYTLGNSWLKTIRNRMFSLNIFLYADRLAAVSTDAGKALFGRREFMLIPNVINFKRFKYSSNARSEVRKKFKISDDIHLIGHVGRFSPEKNHNYMIHCFKKLWEQDHQYRLMLVGDGPLINDMKLLVNKLNLTSMIIFVGPITDVSAFYSAFDAFWLPSVFEGLPTVGLEAQAAGLPLFVSNRVTSDLQIHPIEYLSIDGDNSQDAWVNSTLKTKLIRNTCFQDELGKSMYHFPHVLQLWINLYNFI